MSVCKHSLIIDLDLCYIKHFFILSFMNDRSEQTRHKLAVYMSLRSLMLLSYTEMVTGRNCYTFV